VFLLPAQDRVQGIAQRISLLLFLGLTGFRRLLLLLLLSAEQATDKSSQVVAALPVQ